MNFNLLNKALSKTNRLIDTDQSVKIIPFSDSYTEKKKVNTQSLSYAHRYRGQWFKPEYDFEQLRVAEASDSYLTRANIRKLNKLISAGFEVVGANEEAVGYIKRRFKEIEFAINKPISVLISASLKDLITYNNCMWAKVRNEEISSGNIRRSAEGDSIIPVAGYFILPFETLYFKEKLNGDLKKVLQRMPDGKEKEFSPRDIVHFYTNRHPGFTVGTPELWPALDDIQLLRRVEENVEELIDTNLFPVFQWKVGTDTMPERINPRDGRSETDIVKDTVQYTPASGLYVTDHRHEILAVGSEGRALRIDYYLSYFKNRVFTAIGTSSVDMGEGDSSNRSTASTMSKGTIMDLEALAIQFQEFINFYVINELLIEGGFDPLEEEEQVFFKFGVIDKEEKRAQENHIVQTFHGHVRTMDEVRKHIGERPWTEEDMERSYMKMFAEPLALVGGVGPGSTASETLAQLPGSNITPEAVNKEKTFVKQQEKAAAAAQKTGPKSSNQSGLKKASASRSRPSNQHGTRSTTKTNRDTINTSKIVFDNVSLEIDQDISDQKLETWKKNVIKRHRELPDVDLQTLAESLIWRLLDE